MSTRAVQRWLAAGGEPEHRRPPPRSTLIGPFRGYLLQRWQEGCHSGTQLLKEIRDQGYRGSYNILAIYLAEWRHGAIGPPAWMPPSHRRWAWLLSQEPEDLDADSLLLLNQLSEHAPDVVRAGVLAREFVAMLKGNDQSLLEPWIAEAETSELKSLANGIRQDINAVRAAITEPWTNSPVEGQINRVKAIKRQMYGRAHYQLLKQRVLMAA